MNPDPVEYPKVTLGDKIYEVKFRTGDLMRLKKEHKIELGQMERLQGVDAMERMIVLLQAGIAHQAKLTVEEIADCIVIGEFPIYSEAVNLAISKASPQAAAILAKMQTEALANAPATNQ